MDSTKLYTTIPIKKVWLGGAFSDATLGFSIFSVLPASRKQANRAFDNGTIEWNHLNLSCYDHGMTMWKHSHRRIYDHGFVLGAGMLIFSESIIGIPRKMDEKWGITTSATAVKDTMLPTIYPQQHFHQDFIKVLQLWWAGRGSGGISE